MAGTKRSRILGTDKNGVQKTMRFWDYFADGCGQGGTNLIIGLTGQLTYFYTEKVGIAAAVVSLVMLITKIVDAFTDIPMGRLVDTSKNPKGRCKPWFLYTSVPIAIVIVVTFLVPKGMQEALQLLYLLVTNLLLTSVLYTMFSVPYGAIMNLRTRSVEERSNMSLTRTIFSYVFGAIISMTVIPVTNMLGGTQSAWIKYGAVMGLICCLMLLVCWKGAKEDDGLEVNPQVEDPVPLKEGLQKLFKNKYWVYLLIVGTITQAAYGISSAGGNFYAKYIYGNDNLTAVLSGVGMIGLVAGFFLSKFIIKKLGLVRTVVVSSVWSACVLVFMMFNPRFFWANAILNTISQTFTIAGIVALNVLCTMSIDYNDYLYGNRMVGISGSLTGFSNKVGNGIGLAVVTLILAISGYQSSASTQPESITYGIMAFNVYLPFVFNVIKTIFALRCKKLEADYGMIVGQIHARKAQAANNGKEES